VKETDNPFILFETSYLKFFGSESEMSLVLEMGEGEDAVQRVNITHQKSKEVLDYLFDSRDLWIKLIIWNKSFNTRFELEKCQFDWKKPMQVVDLHDSIVLNASEKVDTDAYFLYYPKYDYEMVRPLIQAIAAFELGLDPSANISAEFMSFGRSPVLVNLYDDRGMEIISIDSDHHQVLMNRFIRYVLR
jgi:hypothetical protein